MSSTIGRWVGFALVAGALGFGNTARAQACVWGSFNATRISYAQGTLLGTDHGTLRSIITAHGGTFAPATALLTPAYLATIDVFYTSLLAPAGKLSAAEQSALSAWLASGGTLIVTADALSPLAYASFTAAYGVTNYTSIFGLGLGPVVGAHSITAGIGSVFYNSNGTFDSGSDAKLLAADTAGNDLVIVLDASTGFAGNGRIVVTGDHAMFVNGYILQGDNVAFANNLVQWACIEPVCTSGSATAASYGAGWPGTLGVPGLTAQNPPILGLTAIVQAGNAAGSATTGLMFVGTAATTMPTAYGGTLLVAPSTAVTVPLALPSGGATLFAAVPADPALCGVSIHLQVIHTDAGASHGAAFSPGLQLVLGS